jgi:hypothetical protein
MGSGVLDLDDIEAMIGLVIEKSAQLRKLVK